MKKITAIVTGLLLIFLLSQTLLVEAEDQKAEIEEAISKLKEAQNQLEKGHNEKAFSSLGEAKAHVTKAMYPLSPPEEQKEQFRPING